MIEDKITNNSFNKVDYGTENLGNVSEIKINPLISDRYEESVTDDISAIFTRNKITEQLLDIFENSKYSKKYTKESCKKLEKSDIEEVYYSFKKELLNNGNYSIVEIFCGIAEFFDINYKLLYNDIISLDDKSKILETLEESYGLKKRYLKSKKLF